MGLPLGAAVGGEATSVSVRVFVLTRHGLVREGLKNLLEGEGLEVVGRCCSVAEARHSIVEERADVVVLDERLADGTGIEVCRYVRSVNPNLQCLMMTSYVDDEVLRCVVLAGASGYVLRQVRGNHLARSVRLAAAGEPLLDSEVVDRTRAWFANATADPGFGGLTGAEREVLARIAKGMSDRQISESLGLAETRVRGLVSTLLVKLGFGTGGPPAVRPIDDTESGGSMTRD